MGGRPGRRRACPGASGSDPSPANPQRARGTSPDARSQSTVLVIGPVAPAGPVRLEDFSEVLDEPGAVLQRGPACLGPEHAELGAPQSESSAVELVPLGDLPNPPLPLGLAPAFLAIGLQNRSDLLPPFCRQRGNGRQNPRQGPLDRLRRGRIGNASQARSPHLHLGSLAASSALARGCRAWYCLPAPRRGMKTMRGGGADRAAPSPATQMKEFRCYTRTNQNAHPSSVLASRRIPDDSAVTTL